MKFFNLITLASLATAVPHVRRQDTITGTLKNAASFLADDAMTAITQIENAVEALKTANTTTGRAPIQAQNAVKASVQDIADALKVATAEINRVTTEAQGSVGAQAAGFQTQDVVQLTTTLKNVLNTIREIGLTLQAVNKSLAPNVLEALEAELEALKDSINPLLRPLLLLGVAVRNTANQLAGGVEKSLDSVITNIISLHGVLSKALGLSSLRGL